MYDRHYATSTVSTYVSILGYSHKLSGFPDPTKAFFIVQMLKGYGKLGSRVDSRLPITLPILHRIQFIDRRNSFCPVQILLDYLSLRGSMPGLMVPL